STASVSAAAVNVVATNFSVAEQSAFNGQVATFSSSTPGATPANFAATIAWGDGATTAGTITGAAGSFAVSGSHTYADEGAFTTTVTVTEISPAASGSASGTATVSEADVLSGTPVTITPQAAVSFT